MNSLFSGHKWLASIWLRWHRKYSLLPEECFMKNRINIHMVAGDTEVIWKTKPMFKAKSVTRTVQHAIYTKLNSASKCLKKHCVTPCIITTNWRKVLWFSSLFKKYTTGPNPPILVLAALTTDCVWVHAHSTWRLACSQFKPEIFPAWPAHFLYLRHWTIRQDTDWLFSTGGAVMKISTQKKKVTGEEHLIIIFWLEMSQPESTFRWSFLWWTSTVHPFSFETKTHTADQRLVLGCWKYIHVCPRHNAKINCLNGSLWTKYVVV